MVQLFLRLWHYSYWLLKLWWSVLPNYIEQEFLYKICCDRYYQNSLHLAANEFGWLSFLFNISMLCWSLPYFWQGRAHILGYAKSCIILIISLLILTRPVLMTIWWYQQLCTFQLRSVPLHIMCNTGVIVDGIWIVMITGHNLFWYELSWHDGN